MHQQQQLKSRRSYTEIVSQVCFSPCFSLEDLYLHILDHAHLSVFFLELRCPK